MLGKLDVQLVLWSEDLHVLGHVRGEVFDRPGAQDGVLVLYWREKSNTLGRILLGGRFKFASYFKICRDKCPRDGVQSFCALGKGCTEPDH